MIYHVIIPVEEVRGDQTIAIEADSEAEAIAKVESGEGEFVEDNLEVMGLNWACATAHPQ